MAGPIYFLFTCIHGMHPSNTQASYLLERGLRCRRCLPPATAQCYRDVTGSLSLFCYGKQFPCFVTLRSDVAPARRRCCRRQGCTALLYSMFLRYQESYVKNFGHYRQALNELTLLHDGKGSILSSKMSLLIKTLILIPLKLHFLCDKFELDFKPISFNFPICSY